MQAGRSKLYRLQEWEEREEDDNFDDLAFSESKRPSTHSVKHQEDFLPENLETLRLSPPRAGLSPPVFQITDPRKVARLSSLGQFAEPEEEEFSFGEEVGPGTFTNERLHKLFEKHIFLPGSFVSLSPTRRKSHSDYEDEDTDITEMNDEDFEGIDDIFGKEESGILSSSANSYTMPNISRANVTLSQRKQDLQRAAEAEDREMRLRYQQRYASNAKTLTKNDDVQTAIYTKKPALNMNAQYIDDEPFEEGLDGFSSELLTSHNLRQLGEERRVPSLDHKVSLPSLQRPFAAVGPSGPKKFKSTMDLASTIRNNPNDDEHPEFNGNNRLIKKLDRMPSFHFSNKGTGSERRPPQESLTEGQQREIRLQDMEKRKAELLEKYRELTEKQAALRMSPTKPSGRPKTTKTRSRKSLGLVKNLNNKLPDPFGYSKSNQGMKFNAATRTWEGNEYDLLRFEEDPQETIRLRKPSLITSREFVTQKHPRHGNMVYDAENLRWINLNTVDEETENDLNELPDLVPNDIPQYVLPRSTSKRGLGERGVSQFTQRTVLTASSGNSAKNVSVGDEFFISEKLAARFEKEEAKIKRKVKEWFNPHEKYNIKSRETFNHEYFWEIRKMVMDTHGSK